MCAALDWGDFPTWLTAVGTLLAFAIALLIYWQAARDRRREQARRVSAWVPGGITLIPAGWTGPGLPGGPTSSPTPPGLSDGPTNGPRVQFLLRVLNGSDELISDVRVELVSPTGDRLGIPPTGWTDVGPGQEIEITTTWSDDGRVRGEVRLALEFTDAAGRRWMRLGGSLHRKH
jgi:hypothetical protein